RFANALHSFGYYQAAVDLTIASHQLDDPGLIDALDAAPAAPPAKVAAQFTLGPLFHLGAVTITGSVPPGVSADAPTDLGIRTGDPARAADVLAAGEHLQSTLPQGR